MSLESNKPSLNSKYYCIYVTQNLSHVILGHTPRTPEKPSPHLLGVWGESPGQVLQVREHGKEEDEQME